MKIIVVDEACLAREQLLCAIRSVVPEASLNSFSDPEEALAFACDHGSNVAFLEVKLPKMSGVELARRLKQHDPDINIIFATEEDRRKEAYALHASGYITKPVTQEDVRCELFDLRRPIPARRRIRVQTFGNFEVYLDGTPISFRYSKTKELLAYLVDRRGALCTVAEVQAILFEDERSHTAYMKSLRRDLLETLGSAGCGDVIVQQRGRLGVVPEKLECDYYSWYDGKQGSPAWQGEYMAQYSWSEYTAGLLARMGK